MKKTPAELIDELDTVNMKIFYLVDKIEKGKPDISEVKNLYKLNRYRSKLKNAINEYFNEREEIKV